MSFFKTLSILSLTICAPFLVQASVFIEPSIGYRSHHLKTTALDNSTVDYKMTTPTYGLKLGYRSLIGIDINLAYDYASGKATVSPLEEKNSFTHSTASVQLGVNALGAMKIYLGMGFSNDLKIQEGILNSDIQLKGQAYQAGLQFKVFPMVMLGMQYNLNQFKSVQGRNFTSGEEIDRYFSKIDSQDYTFSISTSF
ncbi:MAG: hypothetical protein A2622_00230 [Bdellovibrionales bacterium RIFCSPHIGHO2_01_FULL_40_29]|nr:MAG: hypothetical protein A2622_00230 [Bdellovibrionales bacterium RIFCSPHIGHO2_01_FULL_40_29]OFZ32553.1 MAG: hypothetical protein A3D17_04830 [Bdellovibrionales bacterium RIFCSPHIGHO2_02_FULL_40_15]